MTKANNKIQVLVTGGAGFIAVHCIVKLLRQGYSVRTRPMKSNRTETVQ